MKDKLIRTAQSLPLPSREAVKEFQDNSKVLAEECTKVFEKRADIVQLIGENNLAMARDNNQNFARFMASIFSDFEPNILVETVLWVFEAYRSHGFKTTYWAANLNIWTDRLKTQLTPKTYNDIYPFYNWLIVNIPVFVKLTDHVKEESDVKNDIRQRHADK